MTAPALSYSTAEAARMLGISHELVKRAIRSGALRAVRTSPMREKPSGAMRGGKLLVTAEAMREWLDSLEPADQAAG